MTDCGRDAHPHVRQCPSSAKPGDLFADFHEFEKIHRDRRRAAVLQFLKSLPPEDAVKVRWRRL